MPPLTSSRSTTPRNVCHQFRRFINAYPSIGVRFFKSVPSHYQLNSCLSNEFPCYKPKLSKTAPWLTTGKQSGPSANLVKASNPALGEQVHDFQSVPRPTSLRIPDYVRWEGVDVHEEVHFAGMKTRFNLALVDFFNESLKRDATKLSTRDFSKNSAVAEFRSRYTDFSSNWIRIWEDYQRPFTSLEDGGIGNILTGRPRNGIAYIQERAANRQIAAAICQQSRGWRSGTMGMCELCDSLR